MLGNNAEIVIGVYNNASITTKLSSLLYTTMLGNNVGIAIVVHNKSR